MWRERGEIAAKGRDARDVEPCDIPIEGEMVFSVSNNREHNEPSWLASDTCIEIQAHYVEGEIENQHRRASRHVSEVARGPSEKGKA